MQLHKTDDFAPNRIESNRFEYLEEIGIVSFARLLLTIFSFPFPSRIETRRLIVPRRYGVRPVGRNGGRRLWQRSDRVEAEETR